MSSTNLMSTVKLRFALLEGLIVNINKWDYLRDSKERPKGLICPECEQPVTARLSREFKIQDHYAHHSDSKCPLTEAGETAYHLNAKLYFAKKLQERSRATLAFSCMLCHNWYSHFEIARYDQVEPELKIGNRRPDISCLLHTMPVGAVEVWYSNAVTVDKKRDLEKRGIPWFEIPAQNIHPRIFVEGIEESQTLSIDSRLAGVTSPQVPIVCDACEANQRKEAMKVESERRWQIDLSRAMARIPIDRRYLLSEEEKQAAVEAIREQDEIDRNAREIAEQAGGPARLSEAGDLIIPFNSLKKYRWWQGGQSLAETLVELNAPIKTWHGSVAYCDDLLNGSHANRCRGIIQHHASVVYCLECGYFAEKAA